jgi:3-oxoadipate enol-lactonase
MPYFETGDGCRIFYDYQRTIPPKPVILFLNGLTQTAVNWKTVSNNLKNDFQVIVYDARAQGRSGLGERPLSLKLHCSDLFELLSHLQVVKTHLVGVSHGAAVALEFASLYPAHVDRLLACSVSAGSSGRLRLLVRSWLEILEQQSLEAMARAMLPVVFGEDFLRRNEPVLEKVVKAIVVRNRKHAILAQLRAGMDYPPLSRTATRVRSPVLVLSGSDDPLVAEAGARELAGLCNGSYGQIPGVGHSIPVEAPESFISIVKEFLLYG